MIPRQSKSKALADLVAAEVADAFALPTTSRLSQSFDFRKIRDREIIVWPNSREVTFETRDSLEVTYEIAIAVLQRLEADDDEDLAGDANLALVEEIGAHFIGAAMIATNSDGPLGLVESNCMGYEHAPLYDSSLLETHRIFASGIILQFRRSENRTAS